MNMTKPLFIFLFSTIIFSNVLAQQSWEKHFDDGNGERYFWFTIGSKHELQDLSHIISIIGVDGNTVTAWANRSDFSNFVKLGHPYGFLPLDGGFKPLMHCVDDLDELIQWNSYPTYEAYEALMFQFEEDHPEKCAIYNIGTLPSGRKLLGAQINANNQPKPQFLYSATMHGDELVGYILSLRLIDYLLENYGTDPFVTRLVDGVEIWIFPLANPDGTYITGNHTVMNSIRGNANNIDLNRNYPDPKAGPNPDGNAWQPETIAFMNLAEENDFAIGANMHSGAEVCNYPWDTWQHLSADNDWWYYVCREYADTAQFYSPPNYMAQLNNGITNGFAWYSITGGRQDFMNYFHHCREFTLELSIIKKIPESWLGLYWDYNHRSLLNYLEQSLYGVRGIVSDSISGEPLKAKVHIENHDQDSSFVYSALPHGNYHRFLHTGNYDLSFSATGYHTKTFTGVSVNNRQTRWLDVKLSPVEGHAASLAFNFPVRVYPNPVINGWLNIKSGKEIDKVEVFSLTGQKMFGSQLSATEGIIDLSGLSGGVYLLKAQSNDATAVKKILIHPR
jgi:hypothetical protein